MKGFKKKSLALLCAVIMSVVGLGGLVGCGSDPISNESTRLVLTTQALDGVFNPFYSASAPDSNIVGMTQLGMLTSTSMLRFCPPSSANFNCFISTCSSFVFSSSKS